MMNKLKGFRTVAFNVVAIVYAVGNVYGVMPEVDQTVVMGLVAVGNLILRAVTKTPMFRSE